MKVVDIQVDATVGDNCHFSGYLVYCEEEVRNIDSVNPRTGRMEERLVFNSTLADGGGVIHVTL